MKSIKIALQEKRERQKLKNKIVEYKTRVESIKHLLSEGLTIKQQINLYRDIEAQFEAKMKTHLRRDLEEVLDLKDFLGNN